ncbi:Sensor histidine kinase YehU [compost metagenome]
MTMNKQEENYLDNPFIHFLIGSKWRIVRHSLLILVLANMFFLQDGGIQVKVGLSEQESSTINFYLNILFFIFFTSIIYLNIYVLVPNYLTRNRYAAYLLVLSGIILSFFTLIYLFDRFYVAATFSEGGNLSLSFWDFIGFAFIICLFLAAVSSIKLFQLWIVNNYRIGQLERNSLRSELAHLKSQINPHFLFNTLNNIHVLIRRDTEKASDLLLKLSELLRYQLYDNTQDKVFLSADIRFLKNLLELEKTRRDQFNYSIEIDGNSNEIMLPPFLFIPFVENAIKHNVTTSEIPFVAIRFRVESDELHFECINPVGASNNIKQTVGGIGLTNIKRRLELIYADKHTLQSTNQTNQYIVNLELPL